MEDKKNVFGKIKIYGKEIDLDNTPKEDLEKIIDALDKREAVLEKKYIELYVKSVLLK